jgi:hypothetical protein
VKPSVGVGEACQGRESLGCKGYMFKFAGVGQCRPEGKIGTRSRCAHFGGRRTGCKKKLESKYVCVCVKVA